MIKCIMSSVVPFIFQRISLSVSLPFLSARALMSALVTSCELLNGSDKGNVERCYNAVQNIFCESKIKFFSFGSYFRLTVNPANEAKCVTNNDSEVKES